MMLDKAGLSIGKGLFLTQNIFLTILIQMEAEIAIKQWPFIPVPMGIPMGNLWTSKPTEIP